jgi:hypothetical protein
MFRDRVLQEAERVERERPTQMWIVTHVKHPNIPWMRDTDEVYATCRSREWAEEAAHMYAVEEALQWLDYFVSPKRRCTRSMVRDLIDSKTMFDFEVHFDTRPAWEGDE